MHDSLTIFYDLFAPVQRTYLRVPLIGYNIPLGGAHDQVNTKNINIDVKTEGTTKLKAAHIGEAMSSGMRRIDFRNAPEIEKAEFCCVWKPNHKDDLALLIHCDTTPINETVLGLIVPNKIGVPNNSLVDITENLRALKDDKQLMFMMNVSGKSARIYHVYLRVVYKMNKYEFSA